MKFDKIDYVVENRWKSDKCIAKRMLQDRQKRTMLIGVTLEETIKQMSGDETN